jgi:hypothetical protein
MRHMLYQWKEHIKYRQRIGTLRICSRKNHYMLLPQSVTGNEKNCGVPVYIICDSAQPQNIANF